MGNLARSRSISLPAPVRGHGYHLGSPHNIVSRCCEARGELTIATILMRVAALLLLAVVRGMPERGKLAALSSSRAVEAH
jgi:hypothetical protein